MVTTKTDLDRLHAVVEGQLTGRGCGKTFARVHELASVIQLDIFKGVLVVITLHKDVDYLMPVITEVFEERGLPSLKSVGNKYSMWCGSTQVEFITESEYCRAIRGREECAIVWMRHED